MVFLWGVSCGLELWYHLLPRWSVAEKRAARMEGRPGRMCGKRSEQEIMIAKRALTGWMAACCVTLALAGCAGSGAKDKAAQETGGTVAAAAADHEAALKEVTRALVASASGGSGGQDARLEHRRPYYFKEYDVYPSGADAAQTVVTRVESRSAPYVASVKLDKQRFATRMHGKKDEARADASFLRQTGTQTRTYEFGGGRWRLRGSLFVVDKTEENVNGEWVPLEAQVVQKLAPQEEQPRSWFGRVWSKIMGKD